MQYSDTAILHENVNRMEEGSFNEKRKEGEEEGEAGSSWEAGGTKCCSALLLDEYSMILNSECQMLRYSG
jgi:hypothetical protein